MDEVIPKKTKVDNHSRVDPYTHKETMRVVAQQSWTAPLPPPAIMEAYKKVDPELPISIRRGMEREAEHRHLMDKIEMDKYYQALSREENTKRIGSIGVIILTLAGFGVAAYMVSRDKEVVAFLTALAVIIPAVWGSLKGSKNGQEPGSASSS